MAEARRLFLSFLLVMLLVTAAGAQETPQPPGTPDKPVLGGYNIVSVGSGATLATDTFVGSPTMLVFFTPNCPYCRDELNQLESMYEEYAAKGLRIVALAPGWTPHAPLREKVVKGWNLKNIPVFTDGEKPSMFADYEVRPVPLSILFDKQGNAVDGFLGKQPDEKVRKALDDLIALP